MLFLLEIVLGWVGTKHVVVLQLVKLCCSVCIVKGTSGCFGPFGEVGEMMMAWASPAIEGSTRT